MSRPVQTGSGASPRLESSLNTPCLLAVAIRMGLGRGPDGELWFTEGDSAYGSSRIGEVFFLTAALSVSPARGSHGAALAAEALDKGAVHDGEVEAELFQHLVAPLDLQGGRGLAAAAWLTLEASTYALPRLWRRTSAGVRRCCADNCRIGRSQAEGMETP